MDTNIQLPGWMQKQEEEKKKKEFSMDDYYRIWSQRATLVTSMITAQPDWWTWDAVRMGDEIDKRMVDAGAIMERSIKWDFRDQN